MVITKEIAAQLGLTQAQADAINNMFAFVKFKTISELQEASDPFNGYFPIDKGGGELEKIKASVFYQIIGNVAKPISPSDPAPTAIGWYKPQIASDLDKPVDPNSTADYGEKYPNAGNLRAKSGYDTLFYFSGTNWKKTETKIPGNSAKKVFDPANDNDPSTMKAVFDYSGELVNKAFEGENVDIITKVGYDPLLTPPLSSTSDFSTRSMFNNTYNPFDGEITKIRFNAVGSGSLRITIVKPNLSNNTVEIKSTHYFNVVAGRNEIVTSILSLKNETVAISINPTVGAYLWGNTNDGKYYSNGNTFFAFNSGFLDYNYDLKTTEIDRSFTVDTIKDRLNKIPIIESEISNVVNNVSTPHARITIEGQSNALGTGLVSELTAPPYNAEEINYTGALSRIFIWNPKTDLYENMKIGSNNMSAYLEPSFGPELGIAFMWLKTHKYGNLYIDKNVIDGGRIDQFQKGTTYYTEKKSRKTKADLWLNNKGITVNELGFVWVQGEGNAGFTKDQYLSQLSILINDRIADGFIKGNTILSIVQIPTTSLSHGVGVYQAKEEYISSHKYARKNEYSNNFRPDKVHLNATGNIILGLDCGYNLFETDKMIFTDLKTKKYWNV